MSRPLLAAFAALCLLLFCHAPARAANCADDASLLPATAQEQTVVDLNNAYRQSHGLPPLLYDPALSRMALWKAQEMAALGNADHDDPFRTWQQRFIDCGFPLGQEWLGENLAAGQRSATEVEGDWQASPHHNENLLRPEFGHIAVREVVGVSPYFSYWAMELSQ